MYVLTETFVRSRPLRLHRPFPGRGVLRVLSLLRVRDLNATYRFAADVDVSTQLAFSGRHRNLGDY
jgi:hypothetical protein